METREILRSGPVRDLIEHAYEYGAYWIEEPVESDDNAGYAELSETGAPLAGGESEESPAGLVRLGETSVVRFLQGDVRYHEGFTGCQSAVEYYAGRADVEFVPHNFDTWSGLAANAHLIAAAPELNLIEYPVFENDPLFDTEIDPGMYPFDLAFDLTEGQPEITDDILSLSDAPGLGVEMNLDVVKSIPLSRDRGQSSTTITREIDYPFKVSSGPATRSKA